MIRSTSLVGRSGVRPSIRYVRSVLGHLGPKAYLFRLTMSVSFSMSGMPQRGRFIISNVLASSIPSRKIKLNKIIGDWFLSYRNYFYSIAILILICFVFNYYYCNIHNIIHACALFEHYSGSFKLVILCLHGLSKFIPFYVQIKSNALN